MKARGANGRNAVTQRRSAVMGRRGGLAGAGLEN